MPLADTSFIIDVMRGRAEAIGVLREIEGAGQTLKVPAIAVHEIHRGLAAAKLPARERDRIATVVLARPVLPLDAASARTGGTLEGELVRKGREIGPEDCMIAGIAIENGEELVTRDADHYGRIDGLRIRTY